MTGVDDITIVKLTELHGGRAVVTAKRRRPHSIRPFTVFLSTPTSRYATSAQDFVTAEAAELRHDELVKRFSKRKLERGAP